jgi:hypothetical protein
VDWESGYTGLGAPKVAWVFLAAAKALSKEAINHNTVSKGTDHSRERHFL